MLTILPGDFHVFKWNIMNNGSFHLPVDYRLIFFLNIRKRGLYYMSPVKKAFLGRAFLKICSDEYRAKFS